MRKTGSHRKICPNATSRDIDVELVPLLWGLGFSYWERFVLWCFVL